MNIVESVKILFRPLVSHYSEGRRHFIYLWESFWVYPLCFNSPLTSKSYIHTIPYTLKHLLPANSSNLLLNSVLLFYLSIIIALLHSSIISIIHNPINPQSSYNIILFLSFHTYIWWLPLEIDLHMYVSIYTCRLYLYIHVGFIYLTYSASKF